MTTLGDTPTPTILTSEAGGVSIKIEQGVLCENSYEYAGSTFNTEKRDIPTVKYESGYPTDMKNNLNGMSEDNLNMFGISHSIFQPDYEIKKEPEVDIDDRQLGEEAADETILNSKSPNESLNTTTKIRLTPTINLIASPNGTTNKRRFVCPYENCTKSYGKSSHLRSHLTWHTGIKPFVCKEPNCGKGFTRSDELNRHVRTHTGEKPFECAQCTKKFSRSDHLTKHLATHAKQLAAGNGTLAKKVKIEKNSSHATTSFTTTSQAVNNHGHGIIIINSSVPPTKSTSPELITDSLQATQINCLKIKQEQLENNDDNIIAMSEQEVKFKVSPTLPAQRIDPSIKKEYTVSVKPEPLDELHVATSEINNFSYDNEPDDDAIMPEANLPPLSQNLPIKPTVFKTEASPQSKQTLNRIAGGVYDPTRPFRCYHCTKNFKRQDDINRHMRTHTGEKPFACNECDKRFMRSDHLKKHLNTHIRVR